MSFGPVQVLILVSIIPCATFLQSPGMDTGDGRMRVELDAFSGRPNLQWDLTSQEAAEFLTRFKSLCRSVERVSPTEQLGYRGLSVRKQAGEIEGYDVILIYNESVVARRAGESHNFTDIDRELERWLLKTGMARVEDGSLQRIWPEIEKALMTPQEDENGSDRGAIFMPE